MNEKTFAFNNRRQKNFVCNSLVKYLFIFFFSSDLRTRFARATNFPSRKKSITYFTHLLHKQLFIYFDAVPKSTSLLKVTKHIIIFCIVEYFSRNLFQDCHFVFLKQFNQKEVLNLKNNR
jgi:hypothetical protein